MNRIVANIAKWRTGRLSARLRRGVAAVEFALTMPIWIGMFMGMCDGAYCLLINEKVDRIAYSVTDIVTQYQTINRSNLNDILSGASQIMNPFTFGTNGLVIVSSIYKPAGAVPVVEWQYTGGGTASNGSKIGAVNGPANSAEWFDHER